MDAARAALHHHMTDRRCSCCEWRNSLRSEQDRREPMFLFSVSVGDVEVLWCPECDRMRCSKCQLPTGQPFQQVQHVCTNCGQSPF